MGRKASSFALKAYLICSILLILFISLGVTHAQERKKYIVYLGDKPHPSVDLVAEHNQLLSEALGSDEAAKELVIHSYTKSMNAFLAMLTEEEANLVSEKENVISIFPSKRLTPQTTRTWDFVGLPLDIPRNPTLESDVIVAVIDSGIDPSHVSFGDEGYGPPPAKWKGSCGPYVNFSCNNKIIGAKWFFHGKTVPPFEILSPIDVRGHGTHIASTIAGSHVSDAASLSPARGVARGGVPSARLAIYKAIQFWDDEMLDGFDAAIHDGVDIISISAGDSGSTAIAIGSYHAMQAGILTSAAAGNYDTPASVVNNFPWVMTVGSVDIDQQFYTDLQLGNGVSIPTVGVQILGDGSAAAWYPMIFGGDVAMPGKALDAEVCNKTGSLDPALVKGKIVVCRLPNWGYRPDKFVKEAGGVGLVLWSGQEDPEDVIGAYAVPALLTTEDRANQIKNYVASCKGSSVKAVGRFGKPYTATRTPAPVMVQYSSLGPNPVFTEILKPDLVGPGENVLAAAPSHGFQGHTICDHGGGLLTYLPLAPKSHSTFAITSGTSMATPHASGAAAYVKTFHTQWSPAAIKSALMTTATVMSANGTINRGGDYAYGAGLINPALAVDPGLIYDADEASYRKFLCTKYSNLSEIFTKAPFSCSPYDKAQGYDGLNYPSFQYAVANVTEPSEAAFYRTVTNVGNGSATYTAFVTEPNGVKVVVTPQTLSFASPGQEEAFTVTLQVPAITETPPLLLSGSLTWKDNGVHSVRSPIVVYYPGSKQ